LQSFCAAIKSKPVKRYKAYLFILCLFAPLLNQAQDSTFAGSRITRIKDFRNYICYKANPLSLIAGTINVQREATISPMHSTQLGCYFFTGYVLGRDFGIKGLGLTTSYRIYLKSIFENGPYIEPCLRYQYFWANVSNAELDVHVAGGGLVVGRHWLIKKKWVIEIFMGPMYNFSFLDVKVGGLPQNLANPLDDTRGPFDGYWFRSGICLGKLF